jgi:hypothetical protein
MLVRRKALDSARNAATEPFDAAALDDPHAEALRIALAPIHDRIGDDSA